MLVEWTPTQPRRQDVPRVMPTCREEPKVVTVYRQCRLKILVAPARAPT